MGSQKLRGGKGTSMKRLSGAGRERVTAHNNPRRTRRRNPPKGPTNNRPGSHTEIYLVAECDTSAWRYAQATGTVCEDCAGAEGRGVDSGPVHIGTRTDPPAPAPGRSPRLAAPEPSRF